MSWSDLQRAMLLELGVRVWPARVAKAPADRPASARVIAATQAEPPPGVPSRDQTVPAPALAIAASVAAPGAPDDRPLADLGWVELRSAVAGCSACKLCETRRQTVFGVGSTSARWMVVGEAPGEQEDRRGEPFVGAAGRLLDNMLRALGLSRDEFAPEGQPALRPDQQVYIANTLKCRPPNNRNPQSDELTRCEPFLVRQIELLRPRVILAMGRFAVQALLRSDEPIGRLRGRVHHYHGVPLVVTYHPAYLLRNAADKARSWEDLCLAAQTMEAVESGARGAPRA